MSRAAHTIADLESALDRIAPRHLAQAWDNVGLIAGDPNAPVSSCLLCIDLTRAVLNEAIQRQAEAVVAYHPPLFKPARALRRDPDDAGPGASLVFEAIRAGVAIYSPHTALDAAPNGTGDAIAALCGAAVTGPLAFAHEPGSDRESKIVTFAPADVVERIASAMFAAGGGRIGLYERCSFRIPGQGTFFGSEGTDPVIGRKGRIEFVDEIRMEMVCATARLPDVVAALRAAHPYEEPAFDVYPLAGKPSAIGIGRIATLEKPVKLAELVRRLADATGAACPAFIGDPRRNVRALAILVGSAGRLHEDFPRSRNADVVVTGEIRHHDARMFESMNWPAIALGHWASERPVLRPLAAAIQKERPGIKAHISRKDADPFRPVAT